ncbi:hypothetical protein HO173_006751 [Letharia columbiana]|uniref:Uncharacterized protein n=1 Tax=Letharia columbiana TaxID=112416 RepID=A0A8H6FUS3_9LECA|nr:uncharacterized protein HO173_006751 [Letharia columbiana]KAF6235124.1 hypothetical protein HO173_006751 [Letharia columbiana]
MNQTTPQIPDVGTRRLDPVMHLNLRHRLTRPRPTQSPKTTARQSVSPPNPAYPHQSPAPPISHPSRTTDPVT